MKDISPSEREVLERAAEHVSVFQRVPKTKDTRQVFRDRGCFDCDHNVGSMSAEGGYFTFWISVFDDSYWQDPTNPSTTTSMVCCIHDTYWKEISNMSSKNDWRYRVYRESRATEWPEVRYDIMNLAMLLDHPEVYVRQWVDKDGILHHTNSKINIAEVLNVTDNLAHNPEMEMGVTITSSRTNGIYYDPTFKTAGHGVVEPEGIRIWNPKGHLTTSLKHLYSLGEGPVLERIKDPTLKTNKKAIKKIPKVPTPPDLQQVAFAATQVHGWATVAEPEDPWLDIDDDDNE